MLWSLIRVGEKPDFNGTLLWYTGWLEYNNRLGPPTELELTICWIWSEFFTVNSPQVSLLLNWRPFTGPKGQWLLSWIQLLTSKISHICQEIRDIKSTKKPKSNSLPHNYINTHLDEGRKDQTSIQEPNSSSFAMEGNNDGDGSDDTYSSHSTQYHHEPSNPDNPSHHAPIPPSLNPLPSESIPEPPGDLSPSPASRIVTLTPVMGEEVSGVQPGTHWPLEV